MNNEDIEQLCTDGISCIEWMEAPADEKDKLEVIVRKLTEESLSRGKALEAAFSALKVITLANNDICRQSNDISRSTLEVLNSMQTALS